MDDLSVGVMILSEYSHFRGKQMSVSLCSSFTFPFIALFWLACLPEFICGENQIIYQLKDLLIINIMHIVTKSLARFSSKKLFIGANWKSNNTKLQTQQLLSKVFNKLKFDPQKIEVILAPAFIHIHAAKQKLENKNISLAAQNCSAYSFGAYTGEISPQQIKDIGADWVILGHSERRVYFKETPSFVAEKVRTALKNNLKVIFCFGENLIQRRSQLTEQVIQKQFEPLLNIMKDFSNEDWTNKIVLAYEPVWAIGTGVNATSQQAQQTCAYTRSYLSQFIPDIAQDIRIIYGGNITERNSNQLIKEANIDGFLVGGASLKESFKNIVEKAKKQEQIIS